MNALKSLKNIIYIAVVAVVLLGQITYLFTVFKDDQNIIASTKNEINSIEQRVARLEERLKLLPESEKELAVVNTQKMALVNTIPSFISGAKEASELSRYLGLKDFVEMSFKSLGSSQGLEEEGEQILKRTYQLSFIGRYEEVRTFIDYLNQSYQMITIDQFDISNDIQAGTDEKTVAYALHFGEDFNEIMKAEITLTMFTRASDEQKDEIYEPDFDGRINQTETFKRVKESQEEEKLTLESQSEPETEEKSGSLTKQLFTLNIGDLLTSGDTYKLGGPGPNGGGYVGLISKANTQINLIIRENGYEMNIKDEEGHEEQTFVETSITNPVLEIISTMRQIETLMPKIQVYVYNQTPQIMNVTLTGSLLDQITLFNESGERVTKGQTKGNMRVN